MAKHFLGQAFFMAKHLITWVINQALGRVSLHALL